MELHISKGEYFELNGEHNRLKIEGRYEKGIFRIEIRHVNGLRQMLDWNYDEMNFIASYIVKFLNEVKSPNGV